MGIMDTVILAMRAVQLLFSLVVIGTAGFYASAFITGGAPSQVNFILFVAAWTILVVAFQVLVPRFAERLAHKFVILALDALTMLFWFAAFIAVAVVVNFIQDDFFFIPSNNRFRSGQAAAAFGAFTWLSFVVTVVLNAMNVFRGNTGSKSNANMGAHPGV